MNVSATDPLECFRDDNYMATKQRRNLADKKGGAGWGGSENIREMMNICKIYELFENNPNNPLQLKKNEFQ